MASGPRSLVATLTYYIPIYKEYQRLRINCPTDRILYWRNRIRSFSDRHTSRRARDGLLFITHGATHNSDDGHWSAAGLGNS
jgi:hypothetical protein